MGNYYFCFILLYILHVSKFLQCIEITSIMRKYPCYFKKQTNKHEKTLVPITAKEFGSWGQKLTLVISLFLCFSLSLCPIQESSVKIIAINVYCTLTVCKALNWGQWRSVKREGQDVGSGPKYRLSSKRRRAPTWKTRSTTDQAKQSWEARGRWKGQLGRISGQKQLALLWHHRKCNEKENV